MLILASSSRHRRALLERLHLPFTVEAPDVDESRLSDETPVDLASRLSAAKAEKVGTRHLGGTKLVIGSDQVAEHAGRILGKPGTLDAAFAQLQRVSGERLRLHTGLSLFDCSTGRQRTLVETCEVHFRTLSDAAITYYLSMEQPVDAAGSFYSEGFGIALCTRFDGRDPNAMVGLPLMALVDLLAEFGVDVLAP